jgi:hypothetical protein
MAAVVSAKLLCTPYKLCRASYARAAAVLTLLQLHKHMQVPTHTHSTPAAGPASNSCCSCAPPCQCAGQCPNTHCQSCPAQPACPAGKHNRKDRHKRIDTKAAATQHLGLSLGCCVMLQCKLPLDSTDPTATCYRNQDHHARGM